jgi:hypothetical protein
MRAFQKKTWRFIDMSYVTNDITGIWSNFARWGEDGGCNNSNLCNDSNRPVQVSADRVCGSYYNWDQNRSNDKYNVQCAPDLATNQTAVTQICPAIGQATSAQYTGNLRGTYGQAAQNAKVKCTYGSINDASLFSDSAMTIFPTGTRDQARTDRCAQYNFTALKADTATCKPHYISKGSYDLELFKRIVSEGPTWITNVAKREHVMTCITGSSVSLANDAANLLLDRINGVSGNSYAGIRVTTMPSDVKDSWGQYSEIVGFMNQLLRTSDEALGKVVPASIQVMIVATIRAYCTAHPDHSACSCVNATKQTTGGPDPLTRCGTTDAALPGCSDLKYLNDSFNSVTSPNLAPFVMNVKRAFIPRCYSSACTSADVAGSQTVLRPDVYQAAACNSNLNVCFASIKAGGNISGDVNLQQNCAAGTNQAIPSQLTSTQDRSGETVTAASPPATGGGATPTTSGPQRQGCVNGTCNEGGVTFNESDLIIKRGKSEFVDKYLQTPTKQKGAIGTVIFCICCCFCLLLLMMMGGGENSAPSGPVGPSATNLAQERLGALLSKV